MNHKPCLYFDQGLFIGSSPTRETLVSMCCWQTKKATEIVRFDHPYLESLRLAAPDLPSQCSRFCRIPGHVANERERTQQESCWDDTGRKIKKLHLEQSLACNLTCISCSSRYSSSWNKWYRHFDPSAPLVRSKKSPHTVWQDLDLSQLEALHFTGGEPLMNPDNIKILEYLDSLGILSQVTATYNTNGTFRVDQHQLDLWSRMKWIRLHFSLDGVDSTFEYTRYPAKWKEVESNIQWFRAVQGPCILLEVNAIVGIHNLFDMPNFIQWWSQHCQTGNQGDPSSVFVRSLEPSSFGGRVLDLSHLPISLLESAQQVIHILDQIDGAKGLLHQLSKKPDLGWLRYFEELDRLRGTDWKRSLNPILQKYQT